MNALKILLRNRYSACIIVVFVKSITKSERISKNPKVALMKSKATLTIISQIAR